jgi:dolichol-phosphate mannosyltransferase
MSRIANIYTRLLLGLTLSDCSSGFRCYRTSMLAKVDFSRIRSRGYAFEEEILYRLHRGGARMGELPIEFVDRRHGSSKINLREALTALWIIFALRFEYSSRSVRGL